MVNPVQIGDRLTTSFRLQNTLEGAQTANHTNNTVPATATLSNTAAGYTTLGGKFLFAAPAGAETDFALFGFQVPANFRLFIKSLMISTYNAGAAVATTATILEWFLGLGSTAVSLATADSSPTFGPRIFPLGTQGFIVGAAIGAQAADVIRNFDNPLIAQSGRFVHIGVRVPVGTNTASQIIRGTVTIDGYFEFSGLVT